MSDCLFCKIVAGEIPSSKVYEDEDVLAFLDLHPLAQGHTLVIPKKHAAQVTDMTAADMAAIGKVLPQVAKGVLAATGAEGLNLLQMNGKAGGQEIFHLHVHLVPRAAGDGLGYRWNSSSYEEGEMEVWRAKIANAIG